MLTKGEKNGSFPTSRCTRLIATNPLLASDAAGVEVVLPDRYVIDTLSGRLCGPSKLPNRVGGVACAGELSSTKPPATPLTAPPAETNAVPETAVGAFGDDGTCGAI